MKKWIIQVITILLAFLAGIGFMGYATRIGNLDMTEVMASASLPVLYAEKDDRLFNEMHGYVEPMNGSYMRDSMIAISEDHKIGLALQKYHAKVLNASYEVRSLDTKKLIESGDSLTAEEDGTYLHYLLNLKDLLEVGEEYLLIFKVNTNEYSEVNYYSLLSYLGENHVQECADFALEFHNIAMQKDTGHAYFKKLEPNGTMDGKNLGYVNIHSRSGPVTWGDMPVKQLDEPSLTFLNMRSDTVALRLDYQIQNTQTKETYQVREAFLLRYTSSTIYLNAYERTTDRIFSVGRQLTDEQGNIYFGIQSKEVPFLKNKEENVIGFVQQGELWCYDFGQNRLSHVYGFQDKEDKRGLYSDHNYRLLQVEDSGSMDFLVYGYMNRGRYEGKSGVLFCHYDAFLNTVEELFFLQSDRPYQVVKEEIGDLAVENEEKTAWIYYEGKILQIDLSDCNIKILAEGISKDKLEVSKNGNFAAWTEEESGQIFLLNASLGTVERISPESEEVYKSLGFMGEDLIYGTAYQRDVWTDLSGEKITPMYRVNIRDHVGNEVREFNYASAGKYVTGISIVENRIDLSCVAKREDGAYVDVLPESITYTSEIPSPKLELQVVNDEIKRNEYCIKYGGSLKGGSMKQPKVKLILFEKSRTILLEPPKEELYFAYSFDSKVEGFHTLSEAVLDAYEKMGKVYKNGFQCYWNRFSRKTHTLLPGFENLDAMEETGTSAAQCIQLMLKQHQVYINAQSDLDDGMSISEIFQRELGDSFCLLSGCSLDMILFYVSEQKPVMAVKDTGDFILIVGYDAQNITYYEPGQTVLKKAGKKDSASMFEQTGNIFFSYLELENLEEDL